MMRFPKPLLFAMLATILGVGFATPGTRAVADPTPSPTDEPSLPPYPDFAEYAIDVGHAPIVITWSGAMRAGGTTGAPQECVSFRNITDKVAVMAAFKVVYNDPQGRYVASAGPGIILGTFGRFEIGGKCFNVPLDDDTIPTIRGADVSVMAVLFSDHTAWKTGQSFVRAYANDGTPLANTVIEPPTISTGYPQYSDVPAPLSVAQNIVAQSDSPVEVLKGTTGFPIGSATPQQCVNFRNVAAQAATKVTFGFTYKDASGNTIAIQQLEQPGTFSQGAEIDGKCISSSFGGADTVAKVTQVDIRVISVTFRDGTGWTART